MRILKKLYIDGFVVALVCAVALGALLPTSGRAAEILSWATKLAIGLLFFMYGARLSTTEVWAGLRTWRLHVTALTMTFVMYPVLGLAVGAVFGRFLPDDIATGIVFLALVSATVQTCISYTSIARGNVGGAIVAASMSSTVGVFATPMLVAALLATSGAAHVDLSACIAIVTQLLLPFLVGQLLHRRIGGFMKRHDKMLKRADRSFVLLVVFSAFSAGTAAGIWGSIPPSRFALIAALCVGLLVSALTVSAVIGRLIGLVREDRVVLMFVGTSKSVTAGLPIAAVLFPPDRMALIVLPLMIYHQAQLIACTVIAQRLGQHAPGEVTGEPGQSAPSQAYEELLHRLELDSGNDGAAASISGVVDKAARDTPEPGEVVVPGEQPEDSAATGQPAALMGVIAAGNVGALIVDADARPAVERFATSARAIDDEQQLIDELHSAGVLAGGLDADGELAALLAVAGEHPIRVINCDTRLAATAGKPDAQRVRHRLHIADADLAGTVALMMAQLPPGPKVVALVGAQRADPAGGVDAYTRIDMAPGDGIYYWQCVYPADARAAEASALVNKPPQQDRLVQP